MLLVTCVGSHLSAVKNTAHAKVTYFDLPHGLAFIDTIMQNENY